MHRSRLSPPRPPPLLLWPPSSLHQTETHTYRHTDRQIRPNEKTDRKRQAERQRLRCLLSVYVGGRSVGWSVASMAGERRLIVATGDHRRGHCSRRALKDKGSATTPDNSSTSTDHRRRQQQQSQKRNKRRRRKKEKEETEVASLDR